MIRHIDTEAGLMHTDAPSVLQGEDGFMWFATLAGLQRYDGFECKTYLNNQDPPNRAYLNRIRLLRKDLQGRIWMNTYAGLTCFDPRSESFLDLQLAPSVQPELLSEARDVFIDSQNRLFVCAKGKTWAFQIQADGSLKPAECSGDGGLFYGFPIHDLAEDSRGGLWMARINLLLYLPRHQSYDQTKKYSLKSYHSQEAVRNFMHRLAIDSEDNLIISAPGQLLKLDLLAFYKGGKEPAAGLPLQVIELEKLKEDCYQDDLPSHLEIHDLTVDRHNNYWLGTSQGLIKMRFDPTGVWNDFQCFQHSQVDPTSLSSNHIASVYIDDHGGLWMGTWGGGVNVLNLEQKKFYLLRHLAWNPEQGLSGPFVRAVWESEQSGELWIGTREAGLTHYDPRRGSFTHYRHDPADPSSLMNDNLRTLVQDQENRLWIGTDRGLCYLDLVDKTFHQPFEDYPALASKNFFGLVVDHVGQIWAGAWQGGGLYRIRMQGTEVAEVEKVQAV
ncbi:MAG: two-component regulator propeller domain-containing protein, partial [Bacteroidota bacterium]